MKPWARLFFSLSSLAILTTIGIKLHELDMPVARFVRSFSIHEVNQLGDGVALLGQGVVIGGAFVLIGLIGWKLKRDYLKELGVRGLVALLGSAAMTQLLKHLIGRPRPRFAHADEFILGPSLDSGLDAFPSGHSLNAFAAATVLAWFVPGLRAPVFLIAGLVALSRVVRGSHFPTDVFAGAVLGVLVGSLAAAGLKRWREEVLSSLIRTGMPIVACVFLLVWVLLHQIPPWPQEVWHLSAGAALILAGMLARGRGDRLQRVGGQALMLGVAVACGPWWVAILFAAALLPTTLGVLGHPLPHPPPSEGEGRGEGALLVWGREAFAVGTALLAVAAIRSVKGLLPLG